MDLTSFYASRSFSVPKPPGDLQILLENQGADVSAQHRNDDRPPGGSMHRLLTRLESMVSERQLPSSVEHPKQEQNTTSAMPARAAAPGTRRSRNKSKSLGMLASRASSIVAATSGSQLGSMTPSATPCANNLARLRTPQTCVETSSVATGPSNIWKNPMPPQTAGDGQPLPWTSSTSGPAQNHQSDSAYSQLVGTLATEPIKHNTLAYKFSKWHSPKLEYDVKHSGEASQAHPAGSTHSFLHTSHSNDLGSRSRAGSTAISNDLGSRSRAGSTAISNAIDSSLSSFTAKSALRSRANSHQPGGPQLLRSTSSNKLHSSSSVRTQCSTTTSTTQEGGALSTNSSDDVDGFINNVMNARKLKAAGVSPPSQAPSSALTPLLDELPLQSVRSLPQLSLLHIASPRGGPAGPAGPVSPINRRARGTSWDKQRGGGLSTLGSPLAHGSSSGSSIWSHAEAAGWLSQQQDARLTLPKYCSSDL